MKFASGDEEAADPCNYLDDYDDPEAACFGFGNQPLKL
jgi:hypothetical protein